MGYSVGIVHESPTDLWTVVVRIGLSRAESSDLFLSGDSLVSWPLEGLKSDTENDLRPQRSGMFISEIAARPQGLRLTYEEQTPADRTAALLRKQLSDIGLDVEAAAGDPGSGGRLDPFQDALAEYLTIPGMKAALLVSDQGLLISCVAEDGVDSASIAALAVDTVSAVQRFGLQVQAGYLDTMRIEFDKLTVVLAPFAADVMLALVATAGSLGAMSSDLARGVPQEPAITGASAATDRAWPPSA